MKIQVFILKLIMKNFIMNKLRESLFSDEDYKEWIKKNSKHVKIDSIKNILKPDLSLTTSNFDKYLKQNLEYKEIQNKNTKLLNDVLKPNECFHNSALVLQFYSNIPNIKVEYVLGLMTQNGKTFGHAWNLINGSYYDFTSEIMEETPSEYTEIVRFDDINIIKKLPMFNPNMSCEESFEFNGESYDVDGKCSLYPYYKSTLTL